MPTRIRTLSDSSEITKKIGEKFAGSLKAGPSSIIAITLQGDLGAGKTTFVLGFLKHFGIRPKAASPTFVIMKRYENKSKIKNQKSKFRYIYHLDAYRLHSVKDLEVLGFDKILTEPGNIILVEWPEKIKGAKFKNKIAVKFDYGKKENERIITFV